MASDADPSAGEVSRLDLDRLRHYAGLIHYAFGSLPSAFFPLHRMPSRVRTQRPVDPDHPTFGSDRPNRRKDAAKRRVRLDEGDPLLARCRAVYATYRALAADGEPVEPAA